MDDIGWIALHRHIKNHWVFDDPAQLKAWIIILLEVNHSPGKRLIKGKLLKCQRGQSLKSLSTWGKLFGGWGKPRVNRFFKLLEKDSMIVLKSETVTTRLTVCNYDKYQTNGNASDTVTIRTRYGDDTMAIYKQQCNNVKNVKNVKKTTYGELANVLLSEEEYDKLKIRFNSAVEEKIKDLSLYLASTGKKYKSHYATILAWDRKNNKQSRPTLTAEKTMENLRDKLK